MSAEKEEKADVTEAPKEAENEQGGKTEAEPAKASDDTKEVAVEVAEKQDKPKEVEMDATEDSRPKVAAGAVDVSLSDATINVMPSAGNRLLMTLTDGGLQYLLAGVRATAGIKSGRYMWEVKIVETHNRGEQGGNGRAPQPHHLVRLGLSLEGSSLLLGDGNSESV